MIYIIAIILVLLPILIKKVNLDDDFYRLLKTFSFFKSLTIAKIKRRVFVVAAITYSILALVLFIPGHSNDGNADTAKVEKPATTTVQEPKPKNEEKVAKVETKEKVAESKEDAADIAFAQLMIDMDAFIEKNEDFDADEYEKYSAKRLSKIVKTFKSVVDAHTSEFKQRFTAVGDVSKSEVAVFTSKLAAIEKMKTAQVSALQDIADSMFPKMKFNYFAFESEQSCEAHISSGKVAQWTGLNCEQESPFAHIYARKKAQSGEFVRFAVKLDSCSGSRCITKTGKKIKTGVTAAKLEYSAIVELFGDDLTKLELTSEQISKHFDSINNKNTNVEKNVETKEEPSVKADYSDDSEAFKSYPGDVKWLSYRPDGGKRSSINMVVFRDFEHCVMFQDRLATKLAGQIDCKSNKNIKKIKINGSEHEVNGFAYLFKRKSFDEVASYPIFKSVETGEYAYPNGSKVENTGLYVGYLYKDYETKFMSK